MTVNRSAVRAGVGLAAAFVAGAAIALGGLSALPTSARPMVMGSTVGNEKTVSRDKDEDVQYLRESAAAMSKMMRAMEIEPSGDADRDFVSSMVPHHQGAIDMALALLRTGKNERLRRIAQEIIVTQNDEISAMRLAIGESPQAAVAR